MSDELTPAGEGRKAHADGRQLDDNPYRRVDQAFWTWRTAWLDAEAKESDTPHPT